MNIGLFQMAQVAAGVSTAAPLFMLTFQSIQSGNIEQALAFGVIGVVAFFLPGFLMKRLYARAIAFKDHLVTRITSSVRSIVTAPFTDKSDAVDSDGAQPASESENPD